MTFSNTFCSENGLSCWFSVLQTANAVSVARKLKCKSM